MLMCFMTLYSFDSSCTSIGCYRVGNMRKHNTMAYFSWWNVRHNLHLNNSASWQEKKRRFSIKANGLEISSIRTQVLRLQQLCEEPNYDMRIAEENRDIISPREKEVVRHGCYYLVLDERYKFHDFN